MTDKRKHPEVGTSPTTPLEFKVLSSTGIIKCDMGQGRIGLGILAALENIPAKKSNFRCRNPMGNEAGSLEEENTIVTHHKPDKSYTKAHIEIREQPSIFDISPARFGDDGMKMRTPSEFLSSCHLCNKRLNDRDIYMYRGEKAFCSPECRSRQIGMDERREKHCSSHASSTPSNATSPPHVLFSTGIFAI
ncbi:unnamed protein product [Lactuca virosa]|uniref:FLZ-type domain-containing protein n=1 Tax=Lactuca virosa TaxID=75947 RepID=A0AAU9N727_9ASTR|nr:unnamed protein product [Lactuca virosa]